MLVLWELVEEVCFRASFLSIFNFVVFGEIGPGALVIGSI